MLLKKNIGKSIEFSNKRGFFILKTSIDDLEFVNNKYGFNNSPATYIVLGDTVDASRKTIKFYVGESSSSVMNRLNESIKKRSWIKEIFIIISPKGLLTMEVVKSLEYMIYMALNNSLKDAVPGVYIQGDNSRKGTIGYRAKYGDNEYTEIIKDVFGLFYSDVFMYSDYSRYLINKAPMPLYHESTTTCIDKSTNEVFASLSIDDYLIVNESSRITIANDTIDYARDSVRILFHGLLSDKILYPYVNGNNLEWVFCENTRINRSLMEDLVILFTGSLNATSGNSLVKGATLIQRLSRQD